MLEAEAENARRLEESRQNYNDAPETEALDSDEEDYQPSKRKLNIYQKISKHWAILVLAVCFDILALLPFLCVIFNLVFGAILFLYFGPKRKQGEASELQKIALPVFINSLVDFVIGVFPANIASTLIRIALSPDYEEETV